MSLTAVGVFAAAGCALAATLLTDLLWALMLGVRAHLLPRLHFFTIDLKERYGSWAGKLFKKYEYCISFVLSIKYDVFI